jgi:hypothetical protein
MSPNAQVEAVLKSLGWHDGGGRANWPYCGYPPNKNYPDEPVNCPDLLNDWNAIRKAEDTLIGAINGAEHGKQLQEVTCWHCVGVVPDYHRDLLSLSRISRCSIAQRLEALVRTLGLWEDSK